MSAIRRRAAVAIAATAVLILAGCVSDTKPDEATCRAPAIRLSVTLTATALTGDTLSVCRDQAVTITVTPEADGVIHIHGYDEHVPATEVVAGTPLDLEFAAETTGQFPIEFHAADDPQGVEVGVFAVYEP